MGPTIGEGANSSCRRQPLWLSSLAGRWSSFPMANVRWSQVPFATVHHHEDDDVNDVPHRPQIRAPRDREKSRRIYWLAVVAAVAVCLCLSIWQLSSQTNHLPDDAEAHGDVEEKQEVTPAGSQGGTLEVGPGCPSACGSFVACTLNVTSQNNNFPLEFWLANISCNFFHFHFPPPGSQETPLF